MLAPALAHRHGHFWIVALTGLLAGLFLLIWAPQQPAVGRSVLLFAGFHVLGGVAAVVSAWQLAPWRKRTRGEQLDFGATGRGPAMLAVFAIVAGGAAVLAATLQPDLWPLSCMLAGQTAIFLSGRSLLRAASRPEAVVLPLCDLPHTPQDSGLVLASGAGRATLALARRWRGGRLVALDAYAPGGRARLSRNLELAGLSAHIEIVEADPVATPFGDGDFALIVAVHALDHMLGREPAALKEIRRLMRQDGRAVMTFWTPGWALFSVVSLAAFTFRSEASWRRLIGEAGLEIGETFRLGAAWGVVVQLKRVQPPTQRA